MGIGAITAAVSGLQTYSKAIEKNAARIAQVGTESSEEEQGTSAASSPVDLTQEIPKMLLNQRGYEANLKTLQTADTLMQSLLDIRA